MPRARLVALGPPTVPEQVVESLRRELRARPRHELDRLDAARADLDLLLGAVHEQLARVDAGQQPGVVGQDAVDAQHVGDEVVGEEREAVEIAEARGAGVMEIGANELGALEEGHRAAAVARHVGEAVPAGQALDERERGSSGRVGDSGEAPAVVLVVDDVRSACAWVADRASSVRIAHEWIEGYAHSLPVLARDLGPDPELAWLEGPREARAAFALTLNAVNFGSGWWPEIRKRPGASGFTTMALGLREHFAEHGPWRAADLAEMSASEVATTLGQEPEHELMALYAASVRDLGRRVRGS